MQFNSDSFCSCSIAAADLAKKNGEARYLFWSPNVNSIKKIGVANCYVFKSCAENDRNFVTFPGTTYQFCQTHSESKYNRLNHIVRFIIVNQTVANFADMTSKFYFQHFILILVHVMEKMM